MFETTINWIRIFTLQVLIDSWDSFHLYYTVIQFTGWSSCIYYGVTFILLLTRFFTYQKSNKHFLIFPHLYKCFYGLRAIPVIAFQRIILICLHHIWVTYCEAMSFQELVQLMSVAHKECVHKLTWRMLVVDST